MALPAGLGSDVAEVLDRIEQSREEIAELALRLGNTFGPSGEELATAREVEAWYRESGMEARLQEVAPGRANVIARVRGRGRGRSLLFNAHLDTEASGPDYDNLMQVPDPNRRGGWRVGDRIFGHTVLNDRGCMALFMIAGRVLRDTAALTGGELLLTSVIGETGQSPVDEFQGPRYEGKGFGSSFLVQHGVRADYALVAETTDCAVCWYNCGANYYKVTVRGQNMYTPRLKRPSVLRDHPNAIVKAAAVVEAIERWAIDFEATRTRETVCGEVRPKAQVGAIRGGIPWRPNRSSPYCALYVDVRTLPDEDPDEVTASLRDAIDAAEVGAELELVMSKPGREGRGVEPLVKAIGTAHRVVSGRELPAAAPAAVVSMWRDTNVFNGADIPSVTFGPNRGQADVQGHGHFELDDLVEMTKMYALTALQVCAGYEPLET